MSEGFDASEMDAYSRQLIEFAKSHFPRETKNFVGRASNRLAKNIRNAYKTKTKQLTGNLLAGVSRGKPYIYNGDEYQCRVKNKAPHAHLIEHGHFMVKNGKRYKFVAGKHIVGIEANKFPSEFGDLADKFVDDMLESGKL